MLVVVNEAHLALEAGVVVVLRHLEVIASALVSSRGQALSGRLRNVVVGGVVPQLVVEGSLPVAGTVQGSEATVVAAHVGVTTSAVVGVDDGLGVDVGQWLSWPLFLNDEVAFNTLQG